jgi:predicted RNA methylase
MSRDVEIIHGDCIAVMRSMEAGSVDAVVTDPPYGVDYKAWDGEIPPQTFLDECLRVSTGPVVWFGAAVTRCLFQFAGYDPPPDRMLVWAPSFTLRKSHKNSIY